MWKIQLQSWFSWSSGFTPLWTKPANLDLWSHHRDTQQLNEAVTTDLWLAKQKKAGPLERRNRRLRNWQVLWKPPAFISLKNTIQNPASQYDLKKRDIYVHLANIGKKLKPVTCVTGSPTPSAWGKLNSGNSFFHGSNSPSPAWSMAGRSVATVAVVEKRSYQRRRPWWPDTICLASGIKPQPRAYSAHGSLHGSHQTKALGEQGMESAGPWQNQDTLESFPLLSLNSKTFQHGSRERSKENTSVLCTY